VGYITRQILKRKSRRGRPTRIAVGDRHGWWTESIAQGPRILCGEKRHDQEAGVRGRGKPGHLLMGTSHEQFPSETDARVLTKGQYTSATAEALTPADQAVASQALLGWIETYTLGASLQLDSVDPDAIAKVAAVASDNDLRRLILQATQQRVGGEILSPGASMRFATFALIGKRMAREAYTAGSTQFYADNGNPRLRATNGTAAPPLPDAPICSPWWKPITPRRWHQSSCAMLQACRPFSPSTVVSKLSR